MTNQETFDIVLAHARKQQSKSMALFTHRADYETCAYRGNDGKMCFVGVLIPDSEYDVSLEGEAICVQGNAVSRLALRLGYSDIGFLRRLQGIHDCYGVEQWESRFKLLANEHDLIYQEPLCCLT